MHFLHAADLHLDRPYEDMLSYGDEMERMVKDAPYIALERMIDAAIADQVDFVLLAGDLFDGDRASVQAQLFFLQQLQRLDEENIPSLLIHGNHDPLLNSASQLELPASCHVFSREVETIYLTSQKNERLAISGFSYDSRWIKDSMMKKFPARKHHVDYHLGLYHGQLAYGEGEPLYAPFRVEEIDQLNYDYFALGHIHRMQALPSQSLAYYAGTLSGRSRKETGPKGYLDIMVDEGQWEVTPIAVSPVQYENLQIKVENCQHWQDVLDQLLSAIFKQQYEAEWVLLAVDLQLDSSASNHLLVDLRAAAFEENLARSLKSESIQLIQLQLQRIQDDGMEDLQVLFPEEFLSAQNRLLKRESLSQLADDLFSDQRIKSWLADWDWQAEFINQRRDDDEN